MPRTLRNQFNEKLTFENFLKAHERAKQGKMNRQEVLQFELHLESNIINLIESIKNKTYTLGEYREFTIYEPKERIIKALPYKDRVIHQWYVEEFIKPYFLPRLITDTYACIPNRGTHGAVNALQDNLRKAKKEYGNYYILKMDIKKFFYHIDHDILLQILKKKIKDKNLLEFTKLLLYMEGQTVGIPIGNYTSQFYANIYLHEMDFYIKQVLKTTYYVRYMDDFILLLETKENAKQTMKKIGLFLWDNLRLAVNKKSGYYPRKRAVNFCGYLIYEDFRLIRRTTVLKMKRNIKYWNKRYLENQLLRLDYLLSWNSWLGHISHANSFKIKNEMTNRTLFIKDY